MSLLFKKVKFGFNLIIKGVSRVSDFISVLLQGIRPVQFPVRVVSGDSVCAVSNTSCVTRHTGRIVSYTVRVDLE